MLYRSVAENPLQNKADLQHAFLDLWRPLRPFYLRDGAALELGNTDAHYGRPASAMESFVRPLWGIIPFELGGGTFPDWELITSGLAQGVDPTHQNYWGTPSDGDQLFVEMAVLGVGLALLPSRLWTPLSPKTRGQLATWLGLINQRVIQPNNWRFFRVMTNLGLQTVGAEWNEHQLGIDLDCLDQFYRGDGWYTDGSTTQRDYYVPMAFHLYGLLYTVLSNGGDPTRSARYAERAKRFSLDFEKWFDAEGAAIPIGRSLTYRFAQGAFWGAIAYAGLQALPWGSVKGFYLRHLRSWFAQPIFSETGLLTIGYSYPNLIMAESYNAPGSPYWSFKAFLPLALSETHPFWAAEETAGRDWTLSSQPRAGLLVHNDSSRSHVVALSANQSPLWKVRHAAQKYAKFAYSTKFGFNVSIGSVAPDSGINDSMLALRSATSSWEVRERHEKEYVGNRFIYCIWHPWAEVEVATWLAHADEGHIRVHRIRSDRPLEISEGGFSCPSRGRTGFTARTEKGRAVFEERGWLSAIADLNQERTGQILQVEPNTNLVHPRTALPVLTGKIPAGESWLFTAVLGLPKNIPGDQGDTWFNRFKIVPGKTPSVTDGIERGGGLICQDYRID